MHFAYLYRPYASDKCRFIIGWQEGNIARLQSINSQWKRRVSEKVVLSGWHLRAEWRNLRTEVDLFEFDYLPNGWRNCNVSLNVALCWRFCCITSSKKDNFWPWDYPEPSRKSRLYVGWPPIPVKFLRPQRLKAESRSIPFPGTSACKGTACAVSLWHLQCILILNKR